ncbi:hypothetical protein [Actinospica robiniae]|uniref:hypothetical protein n=1 Tax=Actinospica robiniae TaxID=304901 RepID=UPI00040FCC11|nr:hypothetical protein [Actinospica robiniae]
MHRADSRPLLRRRAGLPLAAAVAFGLALGVLPGQWMPPAHGDENMGICAPASNLPVMPPADGGGAGRSLPAGAGFVLDPGCGDPLDVREVPPAWAQYNSGATANTVEHLGTGSYVVWFSGLGGTNGVPQVTAVGGISANRCRIGAWGPDGFDEAVSVLCADAKGAPVDWEFSLSFTSEQTKYAVFGYLRADQPGAQAYQPTEQYAWNGVPALVRRTGVGRYTVTRAESGTQPGVDLVSAYGAANGLSACKLVDSSSSVADVACFNGKAPADTPFTLTYGAQGNLLGLPDAGRSAGGLASGYAWVDTTAGSAPDPTRRFASKDPGTGAGWSQSYDPETLTASVTMPLSLATGVPQVVAVGSDAASCAIAGDWSKGSIPVECWDGNGNPVREPFEVSFDAVP